MSGANHRIVAAVEMLRSLQADGFSVPILVELALAPEHLRQNHPADEREAILDLYREEIGEKPRRPSIRFSESDRPTIDPLAPVVANFMQNWPGSIADNRELASRAWRALTAADQAAALAFIPAFLEARRQAGLASRLNAMTYLRGHFWVAQ